MNLCSVIAVNRRIGIEQGCKKVFLDVYNLCRVFLEAIHNILDVKLVQLEHPAFHKFCRELAAGNQNCFTGTKHGS